MPTKIIMGLEDCAFIIHGDIRWEGNDLHIENINDAGELKELVIKDAILGDDGK